MSDRPVAPTPTDLAGVDRTLARLRGSGHGTNVRATTLNLVAFAGQDDHVNRVSDAITTIGSSRPLRALVAIPSSGPVRATVSCSSWLGAGGQEVRSELVLIEAGAAALPSAVLGLLIPDLPVFLLWQGEIGDRRQLLEQLAGQATRLLLDSDECGLEATGEVSRLTPALTDLAWTQLMPWREALAGFADSRDGLRWLRRATAVAARGPANEASLMAG